MMPRNIHHVLYRVDKVLLFKGNSGGIQRKSLKLFDRATPDESLITLFYYDVRFLIHPNLSGYNLKKNTISTILKKHLTHLTEVHYNYVGENVYVETHSVSYPSPKFNHRKISGSRNMYRLKDYRFGQHYSMMQSILYYIDLLESPADIASWSHLNITQIRYICQSEYTALITGNHTQLHNPYVEPGNSQLMNLVLELRGLQKTNHSFHQTFGKVVFWTPMICMIKEVTPEGKCSCFLPLVLLLQIVYQSLAVKLSPSALTFCSPDLSHMSLTPSNSCYIFSEGDPSILTCLHFLSLSLSLFLSLSLSLSSLSPTLICSPCAYNSSVFHKRTEAFSAFGKNIYLISSSSCYSLFCTFHALTHTLPLRRWFEEVVLL